MKTKEISFEVALNQLEEIVKKMEQGALNLEDAIKLYEEGIGYAKVCEKTLNEAQAKIEKLSKNTLGQWEKESFEVL